MPRRPTQEEVAKLAGTSTAVVSYVLNNGPRPVSADARRRVLAAIAATGYRPNNVARALAFGQSRVFGLVVPDLANPFLAQLVQSLEREFFRRGFSLLIADSEQDLEREAAAIETLLSQQVAGLVWYGVEQPLPLELVESTHLPVVLLNASPALQDPQPARLINVNTDERSHARTATAHLVAHGRSRIAHLGGPSGRLNSRERSQGWSEALRDAGLTPAGVCTAPFTREGGFSAVGAVLDLGCDSVLASNEMQAVGLLAGLARAGVRVPDDLAVVALNGTPAARYTVPSLTAIQLSLERLSRDIGDALAPQASVTAITTEACLVARNSCGCVETDEMERP